MVKKEKDINKKPYDEATLTKLEIFEQYLISWLPVFIQSKFTKVMICDFCAGSGQDSIGIPGSPLRILHAIENYRPQILSKNISIKIILNESASDKFTQLQSIVDKKFDEKSWGKRVSISCYNKEFQVLFNEKHEQLKMQPNLLFIDQYGMKEVAGDFFQKLICLDKTDFLFFISSSTLKRFCKEVSIKKYFPDIDNKMTSASKHAHVHRIVLDYFRRKVPEGNSTQLYPYSLMKKHKANIYGLIFGSKHELGAEKFLKIGWDKNATNGEANHDIDDDTTKKRPVLFEEFRVLTKLESFDRLLEEFIFQKEVVTNHEIYRFTLKQGHYPPKHAKTTINRLKKEQKIKYDGAIGFSYNSCIKKPPKQIEVIK